MSKKTTFKSLINNNAVYDKTVQIYRNKYYNLFRTQVKWKGLNYRQEDYVMRKFWAQGTVAAFKIKNIDELGFAPWVMQSWDMYNLPETVMLVNEHGSPLIPMSIQTVDKDVCLGYFQRNKKPVAMIVDWYIERIAQVEMVINTNLQLHKLPFLIPIEDDEAKVKDAVDKILNNELVLFVKGVDPMLFKAVSTAAPYIIDKLVEYKTTLENELKTYLSIDNSGSVQKDEQVNLDELNANNDEIMDSEKGILASLKEWCDNIKNTFGIEISVESTSEPVGSRGEVHFGKKPGPDGEGDGNDVE